MKKILLIDDDQSMHMTVEALLDGERLELHSAYTGAHGLDLALQIKPDVILLDVEMPEMDGFEVCRRLKENPDIQSIPVIFLTAHDGSQQKVMGLDLGATDYISKPCDEAELLAHVRVSLRIKYLMDLLATTARIDGLTGLWNRTYLNQRLAAGIASLTRHGGRLGCIMIDVDHFKTINDTYGHRVGDHVLCSIAQVLKDGARAEDIVGRYGGEEFTILTPDVEEPGILAFAERIRRDVAAKLFSVGVLNIRVTCSFGVSDCAHGPADKLIDRADQALYAAKAAGRNRVMRAAA